MVHVGHLTRERRFPPEASRKTIRAWQDETRTELRKIVAQGPQAGTLAGDAEDYLGTVAGMAGIVERTRHTDEWLAAFGHRRRPTITPVEIRRQLKQWRVERKLSASSLNHRRTALQHLWSVLDGKGERNPVRSVPRYREPDAAPRGLPWPLIRSILLTMPAVRHPAPPGHHGNDRPPACDAGTPHGR